MKREPSARWSLPKSLSEKHDGLIRLTRLVALRDVEGREIELLKWATGFMRQASGYDAEAFAFFLGDVAPISPLETLEALSILARDYRDQAADGVEIVDPALIQAPFSRILAGAPRSSVALERRSDVLTEQLTALAPLMTNRQTENLEDWLIRSDAASLIVNLARQPDLPGIRFGSLSEMGTIGISNLCDVLKKNDLSADLNSTQRRELQETLEWIRTSKTTPTFPAGGTEVIDETITRIKDRNNTESSENDLLGITPEHETKANAPTSGPRGL